MVTCGYGKLRRPTNLVLLPLVNELPWSTETVSRNDGRSMLRSIVCLGTFIFPFIYYICSRKTCAALVTYQNLCIRQQNSSAPCSRHGGSKTNGGESIQGRARANPRPRGRSWSLRSRLDFALLLHSRLESVGGRLSG